MHGIPSRWGIGQRVAKVATTAPRRPGSVRTAVRRAGQPGAVVAAAARKARDDVTGWTPRRLNGTQADELLRFVLTEYGSEYPLFVCALVQVRNEGERCR